MHKRPVQEVSDEELVPASDRRGDVTKSHSGTMSFSIWELATGSYHYTDHVQSESESIKL